MFYPAKKPKGYRGSPEPIFGPSDQVTSERGLILKLVFGTSNLDPLYFELQLVWSETNLTFEEQVCCQSEKQPINLD
jgi:hypothetical protein